MKEVRQCSIAGVVFTLEDDAYATLHSYLEAIRARYVNNSDGDEILSDIESRIAELILSTHPSDMVVSKPLVDNIIAQLGSVEDIFDELPDSEEPNEPNKKRHRRLYRNIDDAPIAGVCSGIAAYIGCDTALVRLAMLLLVFVFGVSLWVYIILWIAMPAALTARQKLEMRGEPITLTSIRNFYTSEANRLGDQSVLATIFSFIGRVLMVLFKIFMILIMAALICSLVAIVVAAFALVFSFGLLGEWFTMAIVLMGLISVAILFGVGLYIALQIIASREVKLSVVVTTLVIWFAFSIFTAISALVNLHGVRGTINEIKNQLRDEYTVAQVDYDSKPTTWRVE